MIENAITTRTRLTYLACAVARELNEVTDPDERELLREHFLSVLDNESLHVAEPSPLLTSAIELTRREWSVRA